jgi:hypothetical protein
MGEGATRAGAYLRIHVQVSERKKAVVSSIMHGSPTATVASQTCSSTTTDSHPDSHSQHHRGSMNHSSQGKEDEEKGRAGDHYLAIIPEDKSCSA